MCNVQIYGDVYFTTRRKYGVKELKELSEQFKGKCQEQDNEKQARLFSQLLNSVQ